MRQQQARFHRLRAQHSAWKLLAAENSSLILAFLADLFEEEHEVSYGRAKAALDLELQQWRREGWSWQESATSYIRQWTDAGWLREQNGYLTMTDAANSALRFADTLDRRETTTSASHLLIVQQAVERLSIEMSDNVPQRIALLQQRQQQLQLQIEQLQQGRVEPLAQTDIAERVREIYHLASQLVSDFRLVEEEIRALDQQTRMQMIEAGTSRGEVLHNLLQREDDLLTSPCGEAFNGFFQLLADSQRTTEFREQIQMLIRSEAAQYLRGDQQRYLSRLLNALSRESDRIFRIRRTTEQSLRRYMESGIHVEQRLISRLTGQLQRLAVQFHKAGVDLQTPVSSDVTSGYCKVQSVDSLRLQQPQQQLQLQIENSNQYSQPDEQMLRYLQTMQVRAIAKAVAKTVQQQGSTTVAEIVAMQPISYGLEELVAHIRIAQAVGASAAEQRQQVEVVDTQGIRFRATIPLYQLQASMFARNLDELAL